ncbi:FkbM family methyltransferase [Methylococcus sp. Mc7]|uniref:FkbM family methyltransferase n=1 Tax=Methylococcus sp. Mc7 TaxID=2860258 RepID=UPI001C53038F|nr:FkbM family methyltransferase [Methylococcus sp. Mc7]QXP84026.1 FkbM family methyltransferase [Methylococcus sp. Mc7]
MLKPVRHVTRNAIKGFFHQLGADVIRLKNSPRETLAGLRQRPFCTVIDCGANEGQFARRISGFFPKARLYCFEPLKEPYSKLEEWAATQNGRVGCFQLALGDHEGQVEMHQHTQHSPSSSLLASTARCHELFPQTRSERSAVVQLTTLDRVLAGQIERMPRDILLKLDVQGFEDRVLRGAGRILGEVSACILEVCLDPLYEGQADFHTLSSLLHDHGLRYAGNLDQCYGEDGCVVYLDAVFVK